ncbi:probable E3 ubiquitin-protein ligase ATL44 [Anopheles stephensi]|uniref:probable E3 ubiquitin-protein ligase ATL44 n=1 Tax=Anopheles stephensi TaxID=30069 RepID=UPI0007D361C1|nr:probable E3 ubiquitin-protein ligase ATL44 [Anopheles stephensi]
MVFPQIFAFATTVGVMTLAAIGLVYYLNNQAQPHRTYERASNNHSTGNRSGDYSRYNPSDSKDIYCTICLEKIQPAVRWCLPCGHSFHVECLSKWIANKQECPNCRKQF